MTDIAVGARVQLTGRVVAVEGGGTPVLVAVDGTAGRRGVEAREVFVDADALKAIRQPLKVGELIAGKNGASPFVVTGDEDAHRHGQVLVAPEGEEGALSFLCPASAFERRPQ